MTQKRTEQVHAEATGLDLRADGDILALLAQGQVDAARAVAAAAQSIAAGAELAARAISGGGRLIYAAAGSSGLMALADALELPGTFGISRNRIVVMLAGGNDALVDMRGGPEDDGEAAREAISVHHPGPRDCVIAVTASGQTPYPLAAVELARVAGAMTIGIANNRNARLFDTVDVGICLDTPAEVIAGSTRMGAGTAQKIALNMLSTLMAIRLGHVHDGLMVNLLADNEKLRGRARGIVEAVANTDEKTAARSLEMTGGAVKPAILMALGAKTVANAERLLAQHGGHLRPAMAELAKV